MLKLIRMPDTDKVVKWAAKQKLKPIETNVCIYVPMMHKIFDMDESNSYDNLTE